MHPAFSSIRYGPFHTGYHQAAVDERFRVRLAAYLEENLLPQVDHAYDSTEGSLVAVFNEEKFCGPNSLVKDAYCLDFAFRRESGRDTIRIDLLWDPAGGTFRPRHRGNDLILATSRCKKRTEDFMAQIRGMVSEIQAGDNPGLVCPSCGLAMSLLNSPRLFDLSCGNGCISYNFHRDPETGEHLHGHVFARPRLGERQVEKS